MNLIFVETLEPSAVQSLLDGMAKAPPP